MPSNDGKDKRQYAHLSYESKYLLDPNYMTKRDFKHYYYRYCNTRKRHCRNILKCAGLLLCCLSYLLIHNMVSTKMKLYQWISHFDNISFDEDNETRLVYGEPKYFVNTANCRIPYLPIIHRQVLAHNKSINRGSTGTRSMFLVDQAAHALRCTFNNFANLQAEYNVNAQNWNEVHCVYQELRAIDERTNKLHQPIAFELHPLKMIVIERQMEFVRVQCFAPINATEAFYKDYYHFFVPKNEINSKRTKKPKLSVMLLGIYNLSHLNFLREMGRSPQFIHRQPHTEYWGYNKVGEDTFANVVAILTGLSTEELNMTCGTLAGAHFENCPFIWKRFKDNDFTTIKAEDAAKLSIFSKEPNVTEQRFDYDLKPLISSIENDLVTSRNGNLNKYLGSRRPIDIFQQYISALTPMMLDEDFFALLWSSSMMDDLYQMPFLLDNEIVGLMEHLDASGVSNKTIIFLISNQGNRHELSSKSYVGMMEELMPLFIMIPPPWFVKRFPLAMRNFEDNARRLTTHFDLHATLVDLLYLWKLSNSEIKRRTTDLKDSLNSDTLPRGISLFLPVPQSRTCEQAGIVGHWCSCYAQTYVATNDGRVYVAARFIVQLINLRLKVYKKCRRLYLHSIISAFEYKPHYKIIKQMDKNEIYHSEYTLQFQTKPGLAQFEATVRMSQDELSLMGPIKRLNEYSGDGFCVDNFPARQFCYCRR